MPRVQSFKACLVSLWLVCFITFLAGAGTGNKPGDCVEEQLGKKCPKGAPTFSRTAHRTGLGLPNTACKGLDFGRKELMYSLQGQELDQFLIQHVNFNLCRQKMGLLQNLLKALLELAWKQCFPEGAEAQQWQPKGEQPRLANQG